jgi:hypothetical protein
LACLLASCGSDDHPVVPNAAEETAPPIPLTPPTPDTPRGIPLALRSGSTFACALLEGGRVACWGTNVDGQLGRDHRDPIEGAVHVRGLEDAVALATNDATACAVRRTGGVVCWGSNTGGALGVDGERRGLVEVPGLRDIQAIDAGGGRFYAWGADGIVYAWGPPDARVDEERRDGPRRTRLRNVVRIASGRDTYALHPGGHATVWGWERAALEELDDVLEVAASAGGACLRDRAGVVRCALETGSGHEDRVAESLDGAEGLLFPRGGLVVGLRDGRLQVFSYYAGAITRFEDAEDLAALGRGTSASVMAIRRDGRIAVWGLTPTDGAYVPIEIALPDPDEEPAEPALPDARIPRYCSIEVERIRAPAPITLQEAFRRALHDEEATNLTPADLCASMRTAFGSSDCPEDGPWLALGSILGTVSVVQPLPGGRARMLPRVAADWGGTEEFDVLEAWTLRSARPLVLAMITSRGEPSEDETLGASPSEVSRAAIVLLEMPEGDFIEARATVDLAGMREAHASVTRLPSARLSEGVVELWACEGHARVLIPDLATDTFTARGEDLMPIVSAPATASANDEVSAEAPSSDEILVARAQCNDGFAALSRLEIEPARRDIDAALEVLMRATGPAVAGAQGACLFNRGRLAELVGDSDEARRFYERSLAVRPNATVEARMRALAP